MINNIIGLKGRWKLLSYYSDPAVILQVASLGSQLNIAYPIATLLYAKGIRSKESAIKFLFPDEDQVNDPTLMKNILESVWRIKKAIDDKEKILICGDYDVDGITGTSLLLIALKKLGAKVNFFLPHRINDGYGIRANIVSKAKDHGYSLIITVDNGTCAFDALLMAKKLSIDIIVTDHHQPQKSDFDGLYLVNPHQSECNYPCKYLAGVGVVFKLVSCLYDIFKKPLENFMYELFAIGTIADLVPLLDENRYLVKKALHVIHSGASSAVDILKHNAHFPQLHHLSSTDIAFMIAPQINALGRLDDPRNGVLFFMSSDQGQQKIIGSQFKALNEKRKIAEKQASLELFTHMQINNIDPKKTGCIVEVNKNFHPGIIGLIAAKLNQYYHVPTCIFTESFDGVLKGSCRTIPACNIFDVLRNIDPDIITNFGGHKAAAGITLERKHLSEFKNQFSSTILSICSPDDFDQVISIDSVIELDDINIAFYNQLSLLEPFGMGNPVPIFCLLNVVVKSIKLIQSEHIKLILESDAQKSITVIFFARKDIIEHVKLYDVVHCAAKIQKNCWQERVTIELLGVDLAIVR
jgi:single-stranded-DNA-specific exonuclease